MKQSAVEQARQIKLRTSLLRVAIHVTGWLPLVILVADGLSNNLTINPIQEIVQRLGRYAIYFLTACLACTPLHTLVNWKGFLRYRRTLGLYSFMYAVMHFYTIIAVDYGFNWGQIRDLIFIKPFSLVGLLAGVILMILSMTSFDLWMRRLGGNWKNLHRLVYLAGSLAVLHFAWAKKGNFLTLSGDMVQPLILGIMIAIFLVLRIPRLRIWVTGFRQTTRARWSRILD